MRSVQDADTPVGATKSTATMTSAGQSADPTEGDVSAWNLDLSGHVHKHKCIVCGAGTWHQGTRAECMAPEICVDCWEDENDSNGIH